VLGALGPGGTLNNQAAVVGYVGAVGTFDPTDMDGIWAAYFDGNIRITVTSCYRPGGGSWNAWSDSRLKKINRNYQNGLTQIMQINPVKYLTSP